MNFLVKIISVMVLYGAITGMILEGNGYTPKDPLPFWIYPFYWVFGVWLMFYIGIYLSPVLGN